MYSRILLTVVALCFIYNTLNAKITEVQICREENVTLQWNVSDFEYHTFIYWKKGQKVVGTFIPPDYISMDPEYSVDISKADGMVSLHISGASISDNGTYQCIVSFSQGKPEFKETQILSVKVPTDGCDATKKNDNKNCLTLQCDSTEEYVYIQGRLAERVSNKTYMLCNNNNNKTVSCTDLPSACTLCSDIASVKSNNTVDNGDTAITQITTEQLIAIIAGSILCGTLLVAVVLYIICSKAELRRQEHDYPESDYPESNQLVGNSP